LRALVVRLSSIGDVVHTLPVADALKAHGWEIGWIVEPAALPLLAGNPAVTWVTPAPAARAFRLSSARLAAVAVRERRYDLALDLQGLWKSAAWARVSGARRVLGFARSFRREPASALLMGERAEIPSQAVHVIDKNLALLRTLGIEAIGSRSFPLPRDQQVAERVERRLHQAGVEDYAVLNAGGGWRSKLWPAAGFGAVGIALAERGLTPLVTWGPGEEALADGVVAASKGAAQRCFATTLPELVEVLRRAHLVLAADTGPLHLACAVATPVVGLYGPTDPARNGPFADADRVVRRTPPCAPCHRRACPIHDGVMSSLPVDEVVAAVDARLAAAGRRASLAR
jgi:lipopolysaccharide heptosyltransferase I